MRITSVFKAVASVSLILCLLIGTAGEGTASFITSLFDKEMAEPLAGTEEPLPKATDITVNVPDSFSKNSSGTYLVGRGQSDHIILTITPKEADDRGAVTVADPETVSVQHTGNGKYLVKGLKNGTSNVTFYAATNKSLTKTIKIKVVDPVLATGISFADESVTYVIEASTDSVSGKRPEFKPEPIFSPSNVTLKKYKLTSSDTSVAFILSDVNVKTWTPGKTTITATTLDGSEKSASFELTVKKKLETPKAPTVVKSKTTYTSITLENSISESDQTRYKYEFSKDKKKWQESNVFENLEQGKEYTFYRRAVGVTEYYITSEISEGTKVSTKAVPTSVKLTYDKTNLVVGEELSIKAEVLPLQEGQDRRVIWLTDNPDITDTVSCTDTGLDTTQELKIKAVKAGKVNISAVSKVSAQVFSTVEITITDTQSGYVVDLTKYEGDNPISVQGITSGSKYSGSKEIKVSCGKPCLVLASTDNGKSYTCIKSSGVSGDSHKYTINISSDLKLAICLVGDVDLNGRVNADDAMDILKYDVKKITLDAIQSVIADVDKNGKVNADDAMDILKYDVKKINFEWV